jgi:hypothetical protein
MLGALLDQSGDHTQPVVAYGGPAHGWLKSAFSNQIKRTPKLFSVLQLKVGSGKAVTPVLCANHPSEFLFFDKYGPKWAFDTVMQDLVAARWQAHMAEHWDADPVKTLHDAKSFWEDDHKRVEEIVAAQKEEFGYAKASPTTRNPGLDQDASKGHREREVPLAATPDGRAGEAENATPVTQPSRKPSVRR